MLDLKTEEAGLSSAEVKKRQAKYGLNKVSVSKTPLWRKLIEPFTDVFAVVLLVAAGISLWQDETLDAIIIIAVLVISAVIFYVQRFSTERVLRNLSRKSEHIVTVSRNNQTVKINSEALVPGDIVFLTEGEKVPADIRIIREDNIRADESVLTGESLPIDKHTRSISGEKPIYEQVNMLFSGSFIVSGQGVGVVVATGNSAEFGNLASLVKKSDAKSPVQKKIDQLVSRTVVLIGALAVVSFFLALLRGIELAESLRFVIALSISAIPEGLPVAISIILALGMRRMAAKKALVQQMRAVETLGVTNVVATDKTGTLTKNKLTVHEVWQPGKKKGLEKIIGKVFNRKSNMADPLDIALLEYARKTKNLSEKHSPAGEVPFEQEHAMSATVWHRGEEFDVYIKGAPEAILKHAKLSAAVKKSADEKLESMASEGYRVIALASSKTKSLPKNFKSLLKETINFEGFVAVADTLRPEASKAISQAISAGVSVRMITGDHAETAYQIGKKLGMVTDREEVLDCREIDKFNDEKLTEAVNKTKVFARVVPEQKYRLLTVLKKNNITAMTGDGVNDVPALSNAHIGIAMGSGSSIAKDAGGIILLDDNFKTIIDAIKEGRVIVSNIRRMIFYLMSTNTGELMTMIGALIIGTRLPLEPIQILWVNLVTDTAMAIPLGLEPAEKDVMKQKPKKLNEPLLSRSMIIRMIIVATTIAATTLATYIIFSNSHGHAYAQTLAFAALIVTQWASALSARSDTESLLSRLRTMNRSFYVGLVISIALQALVFFGPLKDAMHVASVSLSHMAIVSLIAFVLPIIVMETHKKYLRSREQV